MTLTPSAENQVRAQYERFPYPPIPALALPRRNQGNGICFESFASGNSHEGIRILVVGAGTFEPVVVAQAHPRAQEVVAVDFSQRSVARLKTRVAWARLTARKLAPVRALCADLTHLDAAREGRFDYIIASNVLHHLRDPAQALAVLAKMLNPQGVLRLVTYPRTSRIWMRHTARYLRAVGLDSESPRLLAKARKAVKRLAIDHPIRSTFLSHPEIARRAGLVDAFLNPLENPLSPLEWRAAATKSGLQCVLESQTPTSSSGFLDEIAPELRSQDRWHKLQILDDSLELCANLVLWLTPREGVDEPPPALVSFARLGDARLELRDAALRLQTLLGEVSLEDFLTRLNQEVGPRVTGPGSSQILPGLTLGEYPIAELLAGNWNARGLRYLFLPSSER